MEKGLIFTYALTYGGSVISIFNPYVGLLVYFCFAIITPEEMWWWAVPRGHYSRTIAISLLVGWTLHGFGDLNFRRATPIIYSLVAFFGWAYISGQNGEYPLISWAFCVNFAKILLPIIVGISLINSVKRLKQCAWVLMLSQAYVALEFNLSYLDGFNRVTAPDAYANMDNNSLCIAMVSACGLAFFMGLRDRRSWVKWPCFAAAALLAHVTMFGDSRGGMLALTVTGIAVFFIIPREPKHYLIFLLAIAVALRLAGPAVMERYLTIFVDEEERDYSAESRLELWEDCWDVMLQRPLFGVGPDCWPLIAPEYGWKRGKEAHSVWFQQGAEMGFPGVGFLVAYYGLTVLLLWGVMKRPDLQDTWLPDAARMVISSLVGFGVAASFVSLEGLELPYYIALLGAGTVKLAGMGDAVPDLRPEHAPANLPAEPSAYLREPGPRQAASWRPGVT